MKALVLEKIGKLQLTDYPMPKLRQGTALIKVLRCGICSSDIPRIYKTGTYHFPTVPGHEFSGIVVDVASDLDSSLIGKLVAVFPLIPCQECTPCKNRQYALCDHYNYFGSRCDGGFEEYIVVPRWNLLVCPDGMRPELAALCEPVSVARHSVFMGRIQFGDIVVIVGTGTIGLAATIWAKLFGASMVIVIGRNVKKLSFAKKIGADAVVDSTDSGWRDELIRLTHGNGADVVVECVGSAKAIQSAIISAKKNGKVVLTGNPEGDILFEKDVYWKVLRNELSITGTWNSDYHGINDDWVASIKYMSGGDSRFEHLITHIFPIEDYNVAFKILLDKNIFSVKIMLQMGE